MSSFLSLCLCISCISERFFFSFLAQELIKSICKRNQTHLCPPRSAGRLWGPHNRPSVCRGPDRWLLNGRSIVCLWDFELWRPRLASSQRLGPASVGSRTDADREGMAAVTPETHVSTHAGWAEKRVRVEAPGAPRRELCCPARLTPAPGKLAEPRRELIRGWLPGLSNLRGRGTCLRGRVKPRWPVGWGARGKPAWEETPGLEWRVLQKRHCLRTSSNRSCFCLFRERSGRARGEDGERQTKESS